MKNPVLFVLIAIFTFLNIADSITALFILPGEANPIFLLTRSIYVVMFFKGLLVCAMWYFWKRNIFPSHTWYYNMILIIVLANMLLCIAVYSNIQGAIIMKEHPEVIEKLNDMPHDEKVETFTKEYVKFISIFYFLPVIFSMITFSLYRRSLKKIRISKQYFKRLKWWHP